MLAATLASLGLSLAGLALADGPAPDDRAAYNEVRAAVGRDPEAQLRLALWCERHGMNIERLKHLTLAVMADPAHAAARGLLGQIEDADGRWRRPAQVVERLTNDPAATASLAEYDRRRTAAAPTAEAQWDLAVWCERNDLIPQARAHFTQVVRLDPAREAAWKRLGCKKVDGRWMTDPQVAAYKADRDRQEDADRRWRPRLEKWKAQLADPRKRGDAHDALAAVSDPRAVPSIVRVFGSGSPADQRLAVQLLGQIDSRDASRALATLALIGKSDEGRRQAVEALRARDPREYADVLIAQLRDPIEYEVRPVDGPGSAGVLFVKGEQYNVRRLYTSPEGPAVQPTDRMLGFDEFGLPIISRELGITSTGWFARSMYGPAATTLRAIAQAQNHGTGALVLQYRQALAQTQARIAQTQTGTADDRRALQGFMGALNQPGGPDLWSILAYELTAQNNPILRVLGTDKLNEPAPLYYNMEIDQQAIVRIGQMQIEADRAAANAQARLEFDIASIEAYNRPIQQVNERAWFALQGGTGQSFEADRETWQNWYVDQLGYRSRLQGQSIVSPTLTEEVRFDTRPIPVQVTGQVVAFRRMSCFGAGTLVHTRSGLQPIESLSVGDLVLSQDPGSGRLDYQPILAVHHNPPGATVDVAVGDETIVSSLFHRFWRPGRGWTMARDLRPGDDLRTLDGVSPLSGVSPGREQPVYNLDVAGGHTFFVGRAGVLVHDNSLPDLRAQPFDQIVDLAANPGG